MSLSYPTSPLERTRWILARRGSKNALDPWRPYAHFWEEEVGADGALIPNLTVLLTNTECPWKCLMCDLWQNTLDEPPPPGAIPAQIAYALSDKELNLSPSPATSERVGNAACSPSPAVWERGSGGEGKTPYAIKLYNAGSFFDPRAIPPQDYAAIATLVEPFERVIVECHPALIGARCLAFRDLLAGKLEVAIGLETVHPEALAQLNKRFTVEDFRRAAAFLAENAIALRVFLLLRPPFLSESEGLEWAQRSLEVAFDGGATACCVIPTRDGNGAMEALAASGEYAPPSLRSLEKAVEYGLRLQRGRVFADVWDIERFYTCECSPHRAARLREMNATQSIPDSIQCTRCQHDDA